MNVEYINLPNNKSEIKDEDGNIKKKETKVNDRILLLENKIKKVKDEKEKIKVELENTKKDLKKAKKMLKLRALLVLGIIGGGITVASIISSGVPLPLVGAFLTGTAVATYMSLNNYKNRIKQTQEKIELLETKLEETNKLEEKYENELESVKELLNTDDLKVTLEPVSLKEKNKIELSKVEKEIEEKTEKKVEEKQKKLVLK